jgi:hypothetical protein
VISCQTNKNCKDYKTGVFKFANPKYAEWTVYRTDSTQIEVSNITSTEIHNNVKWISDCEYHLGKTKIINNKLNFQEMDTMKVEIYKTEDDRYFCYSKSNRLDLELEMIKIREIDD